MKWPRWARLEMRNTSYTDQVVSALVAAATSGRAASPLVSGALEICAGFYARAFAGATVNDPVLAQTVTPAVLASIARSLVRVGASLHVLAAGRDGLTLRPVGAWDVRGDHPEPSSWSYQIDEAVPNGTRSRRVGSDEVVHCLYAFSPGAPWSGVSPLGFAASCGTLAAHAERALAEESSGPVGSVLPMPASTLPAGASADALTSPNKKMESDLIALKGGLAMVESTAGGFGDRPNAPHGDWVVRRFSPSPNENMVALRESVTATVLSCCGVPLSLATLPADGVAQRESWRRFILGSVIPVSRSMILPELRLKLDAPHLQLDFGDLQAADVVSRARAVGSLTKSGVELDEAMELAGL